MDKSELPKATVHNMLKEKFAGSSSKCSFSKEMVDSLVGLAREYVYTLGSRANDVCLKHNRKTIGKEHLL
jgi:histone H3/H4